MANDGGNWVFHQSGLPQPFEDTRRYSARRVRDRFTFEMLRDYLEAMGFHTFEEHFYLLQAAVLVEKKGPTPPGSKKITLKQAQGRS